ncbi:MAG: hypothetical protein ABGW87_12350 [Sphingomonadaceae bacterium]
MRLRDPARLEAGRAALEALVGPGGPEGHAFLDAYREWRAQFQQGGEPHHPRAIAVAAELLAGYARITQPQIYALLGGQREPMRVAQQEIAARLGQRIPLQRHVGIECEGSGAAFCAWLRDELPPLPQTCLQPDASDLYPVPGDRYAARVLALASPVLRLHAALDLLLLCASRPAPKRISRRLQAWEALDGWVAETDAGDRIIIPASLPDAVLEWVRAEPNQSRLDFWCKLSQAAHSLEGYVRCHPELQQPLAGMLLHIPFPSDFDEGRELAAKIRYEAECRRASTADPIADNFDQILQLADLRAGEVAQIREAFDDACRAYVARAGARSARFTVTLPKTGFDGSPLHGTRAVEFVLHDRAKLARRLGPLAHRRGQQIPPDPWVLEYRGVRDRQGIDDTIPILEAYALGLFVSPSVLTDDHERLLAGFHRRIGSQPNRTGLSLFAFHAPCDRELADTAFRHGLVLVPIAVLEHAFAIARAVARCGLLCGARIGETLQLAHDLLTADEVARGIRRMGAVGATATDAVQCFFWAKPKGRPALERFYLDTVTLQALTCAIEVARRNGWTLAPIVAPSRKEAAPRPNIFQRDGTMLRNAEINAGLQALLYGYPLASHDLRVAFGKMTGHRGIDPRLVQGAMHHGGPGITSRYMRPSENMKADFARFLHSNAGRLQ